MQFFFLIYTVRTVRNYWFTELKYKKSRISCKTFYWLERCYKANI